MDTLSPIHALWIGGMLGPMPTACLKSFVRAGHEVVLHVYDPPADLPDWLTSSDASLIVPRDRIIRHRQSGSYALFANVFRYALLERVDCIYVDCDVFCVRPIERHDYVFGYEDQSTINSAVLRLPPGSPLLKALNVVAADPYPIPRWLPESLQQQLRRARSLGQKTSVEDLPWGVLGPRAVSYLAREHGVDHLAQPIDVFYPVHYAQVPLLVDPGLAIEDLTTPRTQCIHLYNEVLRHLDLSNIAPSSPLGRMLAA